MKPEALATEIASNSALNVGTAMAVVAVIAMLHATLMFIVLLPGLDLAQAADGETDFGLGDPILA